MIAWIAAASCLLALVPAVLFLRNLALYAPPPLANERVRARCSVLIPARNEESTIANAVRSVLRNQGVDFEVVVLDDDSADQTAQIVRALANETTGASTLRLPRLCPRVGAENNTPATSWHISRSIHC